MMVLWKVQETIQYEYWDIHWKVYQMLSKKLLHYNILNYCLSILKAQFETVLFLYIRNVLYSLVLI